MKIATTEKRPAVLVSDGKTEHGVEPVQYPGKLVRVHPVTARDVFALQMLDHQREKFAPLKGGGVFVTLGALPKVQPLAK